MNITKGKVAKAQKVVLYGPEGIGKSSLAAQFPDPLFIDTEGSTSNMDVARLDKPTSWEFLNQQIDFIKQQQPCKTLIIDTIDWAEHLGIQYIVSRSNKKSITHFGYGEGFIQLEEEFGRFLNKLSDVIDVGINVVLTAHAKIVKFEDPGEMGAYDRYELKLGNKTTAKTAALVKEWADMVLFLNYKTFSVATDDKGTRHKGQGGERKMYATHNPAWDAKNRHSLPDEMSMDYSQIAHIFDNQLSSNTLQQDQPVSNTNMLNQTQVEPVQTEVQPEPMQEQTSQTEPQPSGNTEQLKQNNETVEIDPNIPQALRDLMVQNNVSEEEIQIVVGKQGYFPMDTPILNYPMEFIEGVLVGAWEQVFAMIKQSREEIPFN